MTRHQASGGTPLGSRRQNGAAPASRAAAIRAAREQTQAQREHVLVLSQTGGEALVRRLDLLELIALDAIPSGLQAVVNDLLAAQIGAATDGAEPDLVDVLAAAGGPLKALQQQQALADAACLVGFLDPRLVPTPEDVTDPEHELALAEIDRADRLRYWEWCQGADATAALAPAFPEAAAAPAAGPPGESLRDTSVDLPLRAAAGARR